MKFGLESEKFLFDIKNQKPSDGVFRFIDALSDLDSEYHITNEFVLNMVEIVTSPSDNVMEVLSEYLLNYLMFNSIAGRESVRMVGMGSLPMEYQPHMTPKWHYVVQNSILEKELRTSFVMNKNSPLTPAGNCAGIHIHAEIETMPEYLFSTPELQDKFNMGLMMTPLSAFSSSPYFFGEHEASSMRAHRYFNGVYHNFPLNGGLPHVMESSEEVLRFFKFSSDHWVKAGVAIGISEDDLNKLVKNKGASWNPIRWNRAWNTIELRCLDSDRPDYDCGKFVWVTGAFKRMDIKGENLHCKIIAGEELNQRIIDQCFDVQGGEVKILSSSCIRELFQRSIKDGLADPFVYSYLLRLSEFSRKGVTTDALPLFELLRTALLNRESTSERLLTEAHAKERISNSEAVALVKSALESEQRALKQLTKLFPDSQCKLEKFFLTEKDTSLTGL